MFIFMPREIYKQHVKSGKYREDDGLMHCDAVELIQDHYGDNTDGCRICPMLFAVELYGEKDI